jgi:hypothetical protein
MRTKTSNTFAASRAMLCLLLLLLFTIRSSARGDVRPYDIWPVPQQQVAEEGTVPTTAMATLIAGRGCDSYTLARAKAVLAHSGITAVVGKKAVGGRMTLIIGINGSGDAADKAAARLSLERTVFRHAQIRPPCHCRGSRAGGNAEVVILGEAHRCRVLWPGLTRADA